MPQGPRSARPRGLRSNPSPPPDPATSGLVPVGRLRPGPPPPASRAHTVYRTQAFAFTLRKLPTVLLEQALDALLESRLDVEPAGLWTRHVHDVDKQRAPVLRPVSYTHLRAHET